MRFQPHSAPQTTRFEALGIDINHHAVCMAYVSGRSVNQIRLEKHIIIPLPAQSFQDGKVVDYDAVATTIRQAYHALSLHKPHIVAALPHRRVVMETAVCPKGEDDNPVSLDDFARFHVARLLPAQDISSDWHILQKNEQGTELLLVAARKEDVDSLLDVMDTAHLSLHCVDVDLLAVSNAFFAWQQQQQPQWIHAKTATIFLSPQRSFGLITQQGSIVYKQELPIQAFLADGIRVNIGQAVQEIRRFLQFYYTNCPRGQSEPIQCLYLTGEGALSENLAQEVFQQIETDTETIQMPLMAQVADEVSDEDIAQLNVAFGLALRGLFS